jgi:hypothetical protein
MSWGSEELRDIARAAVLNSRDSPVMRTLLSTCCKAEVRPVFEGDLSPVTEFTCAKCGKELDDECKDT